MNDSFCKNFTKVVGYPLEAMNLGQSCMPTAEQNKQYFYDSRLCNYPHYFYYSVIAGSLRLIQAYFFKFRFLGLIGISTMINLPSAIKLLFYLVQCSISYTLLIVGHGVDIFENLDVFLNCERQRANTIPTIWSALPALALWVLALYLVSILSLFLHLFKKNGN